MKLLRIFLISTPLARVAQCTATTSKAPDVAIYVSPISDFGVDTEWVYSTIMGRDDVVEEEGVEDTAAKRKRKIGIQGIGKFTKNMFKRRKGNAGTHIRRAGNSFETVVRSKVGGADDIDAIELLAACKNFLPVMKNFGPDAAAKDFGRNLKKAEALCKSFRNGGHGEDDLEKSSSRNSKGGKQTLNELLQFEVDAGIHKPNGVLKDPSGAVGFLWMRRSIAYQHALFEAVIAGSDPKEAALHAYSSSLEPFHSWAMRRLYHAFLGSCTPASRTEMLAEIGGQRVQDMSPGSEEAILNDLGRLVAQWGTLLRKWTKTYADLDLEDVRRH